MRKRRLGVSVLGGLVAVAAVGLAGANLLAANAGQVSSAPVTIVDQSIHGPLGGVELCVDAICKSINGIEDLHIRGTLDAADLTVPTVTVGTQTGCTANINQSVTVTTVGGSGSLTLGVSFQPVDKNGNPVGPPASLAEVVAVSVPDEISQSHTVSICGTIGDPVLGVIGGVAGTVGAAADVAGDIVGGAKDGAGDTVEDAADAVEGAKDTVRPTVHHVGKVVRGTVGGAKDFVADKLGNATEVVGGTLYYTKDVVGDVTESMGGTIQTTTDVVTDKAGEAEEFAGDKVGGAKGALNGTTAQASACANGTVGTPVVYANANACVSATIHP